MRQFKPLAVVLLAVFALGAVVAASAFARATPEILPIGAFTDKSGASNLTAGNGAVVKCSSSTSRGGYTTALLGTFDVLFLGCLVNILTLFLCKGVNDTVESSILVLGTFHLRYREEATKKAVIAFLINQVHFICKKVGGTTEILILVRGCAAGEVTPINKQVTTSEHFTMEMKKVAGEPSHNEITKIENEAGTGLETCLLESNSEPTEVAFKQASEETTDEIFPSVTSEIMA